MEVDARVGMEGSSGSGEEMVGSGDGNGHLERVRGPAPTEAAYRHS
jgi:hypothetical protein